MPGHYITYSLKLDPQNTDKTSMVNPQKFYIYLLSVGFSENHIVHVETNRLSYLEMDTRVSKTTDQKILYYWEVDSPELSYQVQAMLLREGFASRKIYEYQISFKNLKEIFACYLSGKKEEALKILKDSKNPQVYTEDEIPYLELGYKLKKVSLLCAFSAYEFGSKNNDSACTFELAKCYEYARGVPQDLEIANEYYKMTYESGFFLGMNGLIRTNLKLNKADSNSFYLKYFFNKASLIKNDLLSPSLQFFNLDYFYNEITDKLTSLEEMLEKTEYKKKVMYSSLSTLVKDHVCIQGDLKGLEPFQEFIDMKIDYVYYNLNKEIDIFKSLKEHEKHEDSQKTINYLKLRQNKKKAAS